MRIAVTGGLSSGKSAFCQYLQERGAVTLSADAVVHQILIPNTSLGKKVVQLLGKGVVAGLKFDHQKIAEKVFNNSELLKKLESLLHPLVAEEIEKRYQEVKKTQESSLFVVEVPLLFEVGMESSFDKVVALISSPNLCVQRFKSKEEYERRMKRQMSPEEKARRADFVIENDGTLDDLRQKAFNLYHQLTINNHEE